MAKTPEEIEKMVWFNLLTQAYLEKGQTIKGVIRREEKKNDIQNIKHSA